MVIEGELVVLRAMEKDDLEELRMLRNQTYPDGLYRQYRPLTSKDQEGYWERVVNQENFVVFPIVIPEVSDSRKDRITVVSDAGLEELHAVKKWRVIGEVRSGYINWKNRSAELGIFLGKDYQQHGFGTEALYMFLNHCFEFLNMHRIEAVTVTPRVRDWFSRFGFEEFGQTKRSNYFNDHWRPDYYMELYDNDWFLGRARLYEQYVKPKLAAPVKVI